MIRPALPVLLAVVCLLHAAGWARGAVAEEEKSTSAAVTPSAANESSGEPSDEKETPLIDENISTSGIYFGHIVEISPDGKSILVKPASPDYPRQYFYLDRHTEYTSAAEGKRKKKAVTDLAEGQRVVVRAIAQNHLAVADEVFIITGAFSKAEYYRKTAPRSIKAAGE